MLLPFLSGLCAFACNYQNQNYNRMKNIFHLLALSLLMACNKTPQEQTVEKIDSTYLINGNRIAKISFEAISGELQRALANGSIESALRYCNVHAYPITDSLSAAHQVSIKRVSDKNRNPRNKTDKVGDFMMKGFGIDLSEGNDLSPKLILKDDSVIFYKPIITQAMCLNCHGVPGKDITFSNDSLIQAMYPRDKAVGYQANQLRGLWRIGFKKQ
jgi:hypothetical protein